MFTAFYTNLADFVGLCQESVPGTGVDGSGKILWTLFVCNNSKYRYLDPDEPEPELGLRLIVRVQVNGAHVLGALSQRSRITLNTTNRIA